MRKIVIFMKVRPVIILVLLATVIMSCSEPSSSQQKGATPVVVQGPPPDGTQIDWSVFAPLENPNAIFIGDVTPMLAEVGADLCRVYNNGNEKIIGNAPPNPGPAFGGRKPSVNVQGRQCHKFIFAHAPSRIVYKVPDGVKRFTAVGTRMDKNIDWEAEGTWAYIVKINDQKVYETPWLVKAKEDFWLIDVPIPPNSKTIQLIVDQGNNRYCDSAVWAWPYFHKE
jgi:hypothetical protein